MPQTIELADPVLSTTGILNYVAQSKQKEFLLGTENEIAL
jgi:quinolinate synthase